MKYRPGMGRATGSSLCKVGAARKVDACDAILVHREAVLVERFSDGESDTRIQEGSRTLGLLHAVAFKATIELVVKDSSRVVALKCGN